MKNVRDYNVGKSDYAKHKIQPWDIILEYGLNYWDGDIVKRVLRTKEGESRRLDYEKIIHICNERIRQIDEENAKADEVEDNETSVFCPSEFYKPSYHAEGRMFDVYSVFEWGRHWYAYLGFDSAIRAHMYLSMTSTRFSVTTHKGFPLPFVPLSGSLDNTEHSKSLKIGALGVDYEKYDYLINEGKLYRYMGAHEDGILFKYARLDGNFKVEFIEIPYQLINEAKQIVCGE